MSIASLNRLKQMAIFCQVIDCGSMRAAGEKLGMTSSAVSQHITQLEGELGVTLIYRSTRKLNLSEAGERYYQHGKTALMAAEDAEDAINEVKHSLTGELRISTTTGIASAPLAQALVDLLESNSELKVIVLAQDQMIDLVSERIDIAIRVGEPEESNFIYHPLGSVQKNIYASTGYLKKYGNPVEPDDLKSHFWLGFLTNDNFSTIDLTHPNNQEFRYQPDYRMRFNDINCVVSHVQKGLGMAMLPDMEVRHLVASGELTQVLPEWVSGSHSLYALTINRKQSYKIKAAIKELKAYFK